MTFASTSKALKAVVVVVFSGVVGVVGWLVGWLIVSAPDIRALGQIVQAEISELGTKIPKFPH